MRKRLLLVVFILIFIPNISFAVTKEVDIGQAVDLALEENLELKNSKLNLENAKLDYKEEKLENLLADSDYLKLKNEFNLAQATEKYNQTRNELVVEITELYFNTLLAQERISLKEKEVKYRGLDLAEVKQEVQSGYKNELDLYEAKIENNKAEFALKDQIIEAEQLLEQLKLKLNLGIEANLELEDVEYSDFWEIASKNAIEKAKNNNLHLELKRKSKELSILEIKRAKADSTSSLDLERIENKKKSAQYEYQDFINNLEDSVQQEYHNLQSAIEELTITKDKIEQFERRFEAASERRERNLISQVDFLEIEIELLETETNKLTAVRNYYLSKLELQNLIGSEIEVSADGEF